MSSGPGLRGEQILDSAKHSTYCSNQERETLAQPILKRARIRKDTNLHASQTVADASCPKEFQCDSCEKGFSRGSELRRHEQIHRPGEFYCPKPDCDKCFKRKDHMINHIKKIHGDLSYSAAQMPVFENDNAENDPDSANYSRLGHFSDGAWNFQGGNSW